MFEGLKEKILEKKYEKERKNFMERWLTNIGTIKEKEDKIICYVNLELLEKYCRRNGIVISCYGFNTSREDIKQMVEYYNLDKPIYYIFDGIQFNSAAFSSTFNSTMIFKNCTFNFRLSFLSTTKVVLENNTYNSWGEKNHYKKPFFFGEMKELIIRNDKIANSYECSMNSGDFGIDITADRFTIIDSTICAENEGQINIKAKEAYLMGSVLESPQTILDLDNIAYRNSLLKSSNGIIILNKNNNCDLNTGFYNVESPYVVYNGVEIINTEKRTK